VLTVNKMDRCFLELMLDGEEAFQNFSRVIENANVIMATYADELMGEVMVFPEKGTVSFSAGLHNWAFTLTVFSQMYASKFGVETSKMMEKLWGDNFFDPTTKKWTKKVRNICSSFVACLVIGKTDIPSTKVRNAFLRL
jgi:elongation factor 2